jgi:RNA polymerase sigma factor (sigma-70 family)
VPISTPTSERNQLVVKHLHNVKAAARRLRISGPLRDELISAGYEALVRAGDRFDPTANATFTTFSFRPVLGSMYDLLQAHSKWAASHVDIDPEEVALSAPASAERQLLTAEVLAALDQLPRLSRALIKAHFLEEENLASIGARLGMSKTRVCIHLGRALQLLREKLDDGLAKWPSRQPASKRRFTSDLKSAAIRRACEPGTNIAQLARDLDIPAATIHTWLRPIRQHANHTLPLAA